MNVCRVLSVTLVALLSMSFSLKAQVLPSNSITHNNHINNGLLNDSLAVVNDSIMPVFPTTASARDSIDRFNNLCLKCIAHHRPERAAFYANKALLLSQKHQDQDGEANSLLNLGDAYTSHGAYLKAYIQLSKALKLKKAFRDSRVTSRLYHDLATVFVRMREYPQAMRCFYKTSPQYEEHTLSGKKRRRAAPVAEDTTLFEQQKFYTFETDSAAVISSDSAKLIADTFSDRIILNNDTTLIDNSKIKVPSYPIAADDIIAPFFDGKPAIAYGLIAHVKQPITGQRNPFTRLVHVGHMFITLIKFNADSSCVVQTFGFYPRKDNLFAATPFHPGANSFFKNDSLHDWDEIVGRFISAKRFEKILQIIKQYDNKRYHLNKNNCTDFGLTVTKEAGISIQKTWSTWPLGRGNNPANAGQSILECKLENTDTESLCGLFIRTNFIRRFGINKK